jgi:hypothetical protein
MGRVSSLFEGWAAMISLSSRVIVILLLVAPEAFAADAYWIGGPTGNWSEPSNWSTGVAPSTNTTNVLIDDNALQDTVVTLGQGLTIQNLYLDAGDVLDIGSGATLATNSAIIAGEVNLAASGRISVADFLWIEPTGNLTSAPGGAFNSSFSTGILWNQGRIAGAGGSSTAFAIVNDGEIVANIAGESLMLNFRSPETNSSNTGEMLAEGGGTLSLNSSRGNPAILDNAAGVIEARGDSTVFVGIAVRGGLLKTSHEEGEGEGTIRLSSATLENVRVEGNVRFESVTISGLIENYSVPTSILPAGASRLSIQGSATLGGDGAINLAGGSVSAVNTVFGSAHQLTNGPEHTIRGRGSINSTGLSAALVLHNQGAIEADDQSLLIALHATEAWSNSGTMRAVNGALLQIAGPSASALALLDNTGGVVEAGPGSIVQLGSMNLRGGILRSVAAEEGSEQAAGLVRATAFPGPILEDLRLEGTIGNAQSIWRLAGEIDNAGIVLASQIAFEQDTILRGGGELRANQFFGPSTSTVPDRRLVNEDNIIGGASGVMRLEQLSVINRGTIQADTAGATFEIARDFSTPQNTFINTGTLQAINGGRLLSNGAIINHEGGVPGTILAGEGSLVQLSGVVGGLLKTEGTGRILVNQGLTDVQLQGSLFVANSLGLTGRIQNDGTIAGWSGGFGVFFAGPVSELTGTGTLGSSTANLSVSIGGNYQGIVFHGAGHTIQGSGQIQVNNGAFINRGTVIAEGPSTLRLQLGAGGIVSQEGIILVPGGESFIVEMQDDRFTNKGTFDAVGDATIKRMNPGRAEFVNAPGGYIALRGAIHLQPNTGTLTPPGVLWNQAGATLAGKGELDLIREGSADSGLLRNSGLIRPEGEFAELGRIYLDGDFQQDSTGVLEMNVAGVEPGEFDALILSRTNALLGGTLDIYPLATFDPPVGQQYTIIDTQGGTVTGAFDTFHALALSGRWWDLSYLADKVILSVEPITADFNGDGVVNGADLVVWQESQGLNSSADADGDGDTDGRDFLIWQRQYGSGVVPAQTVAVPEPGTFTALLLASVISLTRRRQFC